MSKLRELSKTCGYLEEELSWPSKKVEEQGHLGKKWACVLRGQQGGQCRWRPGSMGRVEGKEVRESNQERGNGDSEQAGSNIRGESL